MDGLFVSFEGADGTGKTTAVRLVEQKLKEKGMETVTTREPGGKRIGEQIRQILLDPANKGMDSKTEALLYAASRAQHLADVIVPAIKEGKVVLCDRYVDSSLVYQGLARNLGWETIKELNAFATGGIMPAVTFLLEADEATIAKRKDRRNTTDRLELEKDAFHRTVQEGFKQLRQFDRVIPIDANGTPDEIAEQIAGIILEKCRG